MTFCLSHPLSSASTQLLDVAWLEQAQTLHALQNLSASSARHPLISMELKPHAPGIVLIAHTTDEPILRVSHERSSKVLE